MTEKEFSNAHYLGFFTDYFELSVEFYSGKRILDIGCGPRGSLEWADMALERVGLDPLAEQYLKLGADVHKMEYVAAPSEDMPFEDEYFDVVSSFNSLDHVSDIGITVSEIKRVLKPGGIFLLLSELNHEATPTEPQEFSWDITDMLRPEFEVVEEKHYEKSDSGIYESVEQGVPFDHSDASKRCGIILVKFRKLVGP